MLSTTCCSSYYSSSICSSCILIIKILCLGFMHQYHQVLGEYGLVIDDVFSCTSDSGPDVKRALNVSAITHA
jgi:hypothetical protein